MTSFMSNLSSIGPEVVLTVTALALLVGGAMRGERAGGLINTISILVLVGAAILGLTSAGAEPTQVFGGALILDKLALFAKTAILLSAALVLMIGAGFLKIEKIVKY